ncbi:MAG: ammonium transporter [Magnetococcales bacterium]|nr:ammonium transporter [Magnetococcales bacterium]
MATTLGALAALVVPGVAWAGDGLNGADTAWILVATALVLFMNIPGLALFYGGLVRTKSVLSVLMQCFAITCVVSMLWVMGVYSMAFGEAMPFWGGLGKAFFNGVTDQTMTGTIPEMLFSMFQLTFAIITPALVIGAFAERVRFSAVMIFTILWLVLVYAPICHWVWGGGWLQERNFMDFAGGAVVHVNAGIAALVGALMLGRRKGFPNTLMLPHNVTMTFTGAAMLWVGWFGFNAGSALAADGNAARAMIVTHMGAAAGSLAWMAMEWIRHGKPSVLGIVTGMVAGLGTITPASGFVGVGGAIAIGLMAGFVCYWATQIIKQKLHIDDSLDVFPVHGVGGILGTILTGVFAATSLGGVGYAEGMTMSSQVTIQVVGVLATALYSGVMTYVILKIADVMVGIRVSKDEETEGLDLVLHDERGYNLDTLSH